MLYCDLAPQKEQKSILLRDSVGFWQLKIKNYMCLFLPSYSEKRVMFGIIVMKLWF